MKKRKGETGMVKVTVQREDRLRAITVLSETVRELARALNTAPQVFVTNCTVNNSEVGIRIDTEDNVDRTQILTVSKEET